MATTPPPLVRKRLSLGKDMGSVILFCLLSWTSIATAEAPSTCSSPEQTQRTVAFDQRLTMSTVRSFIQSNATCPPSWMTVTSFGGEVEAAMVLGDWIFRNHINIRIPFICMSSCANYVFPAAPQKEIGPGGLVVWHGSVRQKDFRAFMADYERIQAADQDDPFLSENSPKYQSLRRITQIQDDYFSMIGVDEFITRLGQEPVDYEVSGWAATPEVMQRYGIRNVTAPAGYGDLKYLQRLSGLKFLFKGTFMSFRTDEAGNIVPLSKEAINSSWPQH